MSISPEKNLEGFVHEMRDYYMDFLMPDTEELWSDDVWGNSRTGWLLTRRAGETLRFNVISKSKYVAKKYQVTKDYQDFMKAILISYKKKNNSSFGSLKHLLISLKRIYIALLLYSDGPDPCNISGGIIKKVEKDLQASGYQNLRMILNYAIYVNNACIRYGISRFGGSYFGTTAWQRRNLNTDINKHVENGYVDDKSRPGKGKLISYDAFKFLAAITNNPRHDFEKLGCKVADILFATGMRINEVLYLPKDCLVKKEISKSLSEKYGSSIRFRYGIKYYPEKGFKKRVKWLEGNASEVVIKAYYEALDVTKEYREHAQLSEKDKNRDLLSEYAGMGSSISNKFVRESIFIPMAYYGKEGSEPVSKSKTVDHSRQNSLHVFLKKFGVQDCNNIDRSEAEKIVRLHLDKKDFTRVELPISGKRIVDKISNFLFIAPHAALSTRQGILVKHAIKLLMSNQFDKFIGASKECHSIFSIRNLTEDDGSKIKINTHHFRHNINTFLALAGIYEHLQAIAMGRLSLSQNKTYQHLSIEEDCGDRREHFDKCNKTTLKAVNSNHLPESLSPLRVNTPLEVLKQGGCINWDTNISEQRNIESAFHSFDSSEHSQDYLSEMLDIGCLAGEMQEVYKHIKEERGQDRAAELGKVNAGSLHILPNGACSKHIALHKCSQALKCLNGSGCSHLLLTGRPGELEGILELHDKSKKNLEVLKSQFGDNLNYSREIKYQEEDIRSYEKLIKRAREALALKTPLQAFPDGSNEHSGHDRITLVDLFAKFQTKVNKS